MKSSKPAPSTSPAAPAAPDRQRYASASGPVNRRTAVQPLAAVPLPRTVRKKLESRKTQHHTHHLLGSPLAQQLAPRPTKARTTTATIALALGLTLSGAGLLIAGLQASPVLAGVSVLVGAAVGGFALVQRRRRAVWRAGMGAGAAVSSYAFEPQALTVLDTVLAHLAPQVPAATLQQLVGLKTTLARIAPLLASCTVNEQFTQDDKFYITELVRRYLPDTLQAYLQVPAAQRTVAAVDGNSALAMLGDQLSQLQAELSRREALLVQGASEALQKQQRFLQAKHAGG